MKNESNCTIEIRVAAIIPLNSTMIFYLTICLFFSILSLEILFFLYKVVTCMHVAKNIAKRIYIKNI